MRLKILVTGAAGFIGSHTVDHLLAAGHTVWGVDNFRTGRRENLAAALGQPTFTLVELDVTDESAFGSLVEQIRPEAIVHLAALVSVPESIADPALNHRQISWQRRSLPKRRCITMSAESYSPHRRQSTAIPA